ncbi:hypothetical protein KTT_44380 [Tengunoibacter tsumagoiensis]|uniref:Uncharacterized protein n=2 Tax=Tengunoibacter tsumagoiensis TaxID=2014871 RepID=A0A402A664_9CHLR|nr:hypothetical protein KTT_44380 [Tengunoibacter tsumagoiensis]
MPDQFHQAPLLQWYECVTQTLALLPAILQSLASIDASSQEQLQWSRRTSMSPSSIKVDQRATMNRNIAGQPPILFVGDQQLTQEYAKERLYGAALVFQYRELVQTLKQIGEQYQVLSEPLAAELAQAVAILQKHQLSFEALSERARYCDIGGLVQELGQALSQQGAEGYRKLLRIWQQVRPLFETRKKLSARLLSFPDDEGVYPWLYELWILLECLAFLEQKQKLLPGAIKVRPGKLLCRFSWENQSYWLEYVALPPAPVQIVSRPTPGLRSGLFITRKRYPQSTVVIKGKTIWREPALRIATSYRYETAYEELLRTFAELSVQEAPVALLFYAATEQEMKVKLSGAVRLRPDLYRTNQRLASLVDPSQGTERGPQVIPYLFVPALSTAERTRLWQQAFEQLEVCFPDRPAPTCQYIFVDNEARADEVNLSLDYDLICPKPHIGPQIFDLVNRARHCLQDPRFCHVIGTKFDLPVKPIKNALDLSREIAYHRQHLEKRLDSMADEEHYQLAVDQTIERVGTMINFYIQTRSDTAHVIDQFKRWPFGRYWDRKASFCLDEQVRLSLMGGEYVWNQYVDLNQQDIDWAAAAIQYCRAFERELMLRLFDPLQSASTEGQADKETKQLKSSNKGRKMENIVLGDYIRAFSARENDPGKGDYYHKANWLLWLEYVDTVVKGEWRERDGTVSAKEGFTNLIGAIKAHNLHQKRNELAHGERVSREAAEELKDLILGTSFQKGLLCLLIENIPRKDKNMVI